MSGNGEEPRAQIGVLLVHGIGDQQKGDTVVEMGGPLIDWLTRWLEGMCQRWISQGFRQETLVNWLRKSGCTGDTRPDQYWDALRVVQANGRPDLELIANTYGPMSRECLEKWDLVQPMGEAAREKSKIPPLSANQITAIAEKNELPFVAARARLVDAALKESGNDPARMRLRIDTLDPACEHRSEEWLFAEAHWAQSFVRPSAGRVGIWSAFVSPYIVASLYTAQMKEAAHALSGRRADMPRAIGLLRLSLFVALFPALPSLTILVQLALLLVAGLTIIPLEIVRKRIQAVQYALSAVFGDSYLFVESPPNRAAIVRSVRRDLEWLASRCRNLVILAHSQGAYIALETLHTSLPRELRLFITVGSGIERLDALRRVRTGAGLSLRIAMVLSWLSCYLTFEAVYQTVTGQHRIWYLVMALVSILFYTMMFVVFGADTKADLHPGWPNLLLRRKIRWLDYFTADDPVPGGSPSIWQAARQKVTNFGSTVFDHASYWANRDQFVPSVLDAIMRAGESQIRVDRLTNRDGLLLQLAARWRPYRLAWLRVGWWLSTLSWLAVGLRRRNDLAVWGRAAQEKLRWAGMFFHTQAFGKAVNLRADTAGVWLMVVAWAASCALGIALWSLWERRDAGFLTERLSLIVDTNYVTLLYHFCAMLYVQALALIVAIAACLLFHLGFSVLLWVWPVPAFILTCALVYSGGRVYRTTVRERSRTAISVEEAAKLAHTTAYEVRKQCTILNRDFDAMAYSDTMYSEEELVSKADALKLKEKIEALRQQYSMYR